MTKSDSDKPYDLAERTHLFGKTVRALVKRFKHTIANVEDIRQVVRSSGSVGANYIEANDALSKKDFLNRLRIARKECKETNHWLDYLDCEKDQNLQTERDALMQETTELVKSSSPSLARMRVSKF